MQYIFAASLGFMQQTSLKDTIHGFIDDPSLIWEWVREHWLVFSEWLSQPHVIAILMAWWITFTLVMTIMMSLGFGPVGVLSGSLAAGFQSWMYGGFTPAAGMFATLTSVGMMGIALPTFTIIAALIATIVAVITLSSVRG